MAEKIGSKIYIRHGDTDTLEISDINYDLAGASVELTLKNSLSENPFLTINGTVDAVNKKIQIPFSLETMSQLGIKSYFCHIRIYFPDNNNKTVFPESSSTLYAELVVNPD